MGKGRQGIVDSMGWFVDMLINICVGGDHCACLTTMVQLCKDYIMVQLCKDHIMAQYVRIVS